MRGSYAAARNADLGWPPGVASLVGTHGSGVRSPCVPPSDVNSDTCDSVSSDRAECYDSVLREPSMPTFPEWWNWDLSFTSHAELRMEQRGVTEVEVRLCWSEQHHSGPT